MYDKFEQISATAQVCAAVLGNTETGDFALLPLTGQPISHPDLQRVMLSRHLRFCGIVGLVDGSTQTALSQPIEDAEMLALVDTFTRLCVQVDAERAGAETRDDSEQWLWRLWSLKDPRQDA
jgi:hypothetical protein